MKRTCFNLLLFFICLSAGAQSSERVFNIKAFLPNWKGAAIRLIVDDRTRFDGIIENDIFSFTGASELPKQALIEIKKQKQTVFVPFFIEEGTIKLRDAGNRQIIAFNTISNDTYLAINKHFDSVTALQHGRTFLESMAFKRSLASEFIKQNLSSIVSVQLLKDFFYLQPEANDTIYYNLVFSLSKSLNNLPSVQRMRQEASTRNLTAIGRIAPKYILPDTAQRKNELYETGYYTLVDFWASWCIPCRKENPQLVKIFEKHRGNGLKITGVSLDTNFRLWKSAINKDKLAGRQLSDLKGWESAVVLAYGIKTIPMNFLIDDRGVIIAKNLYASDLDSLLSKVLNPGSENVHH